MDRTNKTVIFVMVVLCLAAVGTSASCSSYVVQSTCQANSCKWTNTTCIATSSSCLTTEYFENSSSTCVACSSATSAICDSSCSGFSFLSSACTSCTVKHSQCTNCDATDCLACQSGFVIDNAIDPKVCIDSLCSISQCQTCSSATKCDVCSSGFKPSSPNFDSCITAACSISSCLNCESATTCALCQNGYLLNNANQECKLVCNDVFCDTCNTVDTCVTCVTDYSYNSDANACKLVCLVDNCDSCSIKTTCDTCVTGFKVSTDFTSCIIICDDANCDVCSTASSCLTCKTGYSFVTVNSTASCQLALCSITNCVICKSATKCATCITGYLPSTSEKTCKGQCLASISNCKSCSSNTLCSSCSPGFFLAADKLSCTAQCSIVQCLTCAGPSTCAICNANYLVSSDSLTCNPNCGISQCDSCDTITTCSVCISGYELNTAKTFCSINCNLDEYFSNSQCQLCSTTITNSATCNENSVGTVVATSCTWGYYVSGANTCQKCSDVLTDCLSCDSPTICNNCASGKIKSGNVCISPPSCTVSRCTECQAGDPAVCITCNTGFLLANSASTCEAITCLTGQFYNTDTLQCTCNYGTFLSGGTCVACDGVTCASCNSGGCIKCRNNYYLSGGFCLDCPDNCKKCTNGLYCSTCNIGYSLFEGVCQISSVTIASAVFPAARRLLFEESFNSSLSHQRLLQSSRQAACPAGCSGCSNGQGGNLVCSTNYHGFVRHQGVIKRCTNTDCKKCAPSDLGQCTSCYDGYFFGGGACNACTATNALTCTQSLDFAVSCKPEFVAVNGVCTACADNCKKCDLSGAGNCDNFYCIAGYTKLQGTSNCTECFSGCSVCQTSDPSTCLSCNDEYFLNSSNLCESCETGCEICTNAATCTECLRDFVLENATCKSRLDYPCLAQTDTVCTQCYIGFSLNNGSCQNDFSCNSDSSCISCPKKFYLSSSKTCLACTASDLNCEFCRTDDPSICLGCAIGFYISTTSTCTACPTGCSTCISQKLCLVQIDGYYLDEDLGGTTIGSVSVCSSNCRTCQKTSTECSSCNSGYKAFGGKCVKQEYFTINMVMTPTQLMADGGWYNSSETQEIRTAQGLSKINQIYAAFCEVRGCADNFTDLTFVSLQGGSLVSTFIAEQQTNDTTMEADDIVAKFEATDSTPNFEINSISVSGATSTTTPDNEVNLGIILGISIPLVILLIILIIFIKIKYTDEDQKDEFETDKQIDYFEEI